MIPHRWGRFSHSPNSVIQSELPRTALADAAEERDERVLDRVRDRRDYVSHEHEPPPSVVEQNVGRDERGKEPGRVVGPVAGAEGHDEHEDHRDEQEERFRSERRLAPQAVGQPGDERDDRRA